MGRAWSTIPVPAIFINWRKLPQPGKPIQAHEWMTLPGVGPYIAAAITSISLGKAEAVCDGNLVHVLSRIFAIDEEFKDGATAQKKLKPISD